RLYHYSSHLLYILTYYYCSFFVFFFFNDPPTTEIYTLSLHDALPISVAGAALMLAAVPSHYTDNHIAILWLVGTEVFLIAGAMVQEVVFRRLGLLTGLLVGIRLIGFDFRDLVNLRSHGEGLEPAAGTLFAFCAMVFYLNDLAIGTRWREFFESSPDRPLLTVHSYFGAFAGGAAAWALLLQDWTAMAFAALMLALAAMGKALESRHLQVQYALLGLLA